MRIIAVYDDTGRKSEVIADIIGEKGFSEVVVKRKYLEDYYREAISKVCPELIWKKVCSAYEYENLLKDLEVYTYDNIRVLHCFSNYIFSDTEKALLSVRKLAYIDSAFTAISNKRAVMSMFVDVNSYVDYLKKIMSGKKAWDCSREIEDYFEIEGMVDIGIISNFIQCVTGNFDSRYFNSLKGNDYTIVKSSSNTRKIKAEYSFYHLLPEDMKYWFVLPFDYKEENGVASYSMERLHMTDLAIKWVHGSMDEKEFSGLLDRYFYFFNCRHKKQCGEDEYEKLSKELFETKVRSRVEELKNHKDYDKIKKLTDVSKDIDIDAILNHYLGLKKRVEKKIKQEPMLVIGHGDPCFANALYNKSTQTLKFIDPKGALSEEELWTNPYYDIAKLSHSICGNYDFFNNALYSVELDEDFSYKLEIPFDNSAFKRIFEHKLLENGYDYKLVRLYEASLFISMLPLHMDNIHKVLGFMINANNILEELETDV